MAFSTMTGALLLSPYVVKETRKYFNERVKHKKSLK